MCMYGFGCWMNKDVSARVCLENAEAFFLHLKKSAACRIAKKVGSCTFYVKHFFVHRPTLNSKVYLLTFWKKGGRGGGCNW